jgi:hypothetical protein
MMRNDSAPAGRGKTILIVILIAANLLMLAIAIITVPPNLGGIIKKNETPAAVKPSSSRTAKEPADMPEPADKPAQSEKSAQADEPAQAETAVNELSTYERPDLGDFLWYTEDVFYNGVPDGAAIIDNVKYTTGGWKGLIIYDPDNDYGANAREFLNVDIAGTEEELEVTLDWYMLFISGEGNSLDETDMEDIVYDGGWVGGGIRAFGLGELRLRRLYDLNDKQYAFGTLDTPDGIPAFIALVRP